MDAPSSPSATRVGEVVQASTSEFVAQCYRLHEPPPLGSLVKTSDGGVDIFAVVYNAATESIDPSRKPIALGENESTQDGVYASHPQLAMLFRTDFQAIVVGYKNGDSSRQYLPPHPARVHGFVHVSSPEELRDFTSSLHCLRTLVTSPSILTDDVTAAFIRHAGAAHEAPDAFRVRAGKELATLLANDLPRLSGLLRMLSK